MNFLSFEFVLLVCAALVVSRLGRVPRNLSLLLLSYVFYGWWDWRFLLLLLANSSVNYVAGLAIGERRGRPSSLTILTVTILFNLAILGFFKYFGFFIESANLALESLGVVNGLPFIDIVLPVGISFFTFQSISYIVDVYGRKQQAETSALDFFLFTSFFPQLVAGPIERASSLLPQIAKPHTTGTAVALSGLYLIALGVFQKAVIADNLGRLVDGVYQNEGAKAVELVLALYAFAFQIYCDFAGYTNIARGVARLLGFELSLNFSQPYLATNPREFWRCWHMTLSRWFRDYLYIPLGGNRYGLSRHLFALVVTMTVAGLWHGAAWNFVLWGLFHGGLLAAFVLWDTFLIQRYRVTAFLKDRHLYPVWKFAAWLVFFHLVVFSWLLFRMEDVSWLDRYHELIFIEPNWEWAVAGHFTLLFIWAPVVMAFDWYVRRSGNAEPWLTWHPVPQTLFLVGLFYGIVLFGSFDVPEFIYFEF